MIKIPAYLRGFSSRADGSAGVRFVTQELTPDDWPHLQESLGDFGWLIFTSEKQVSIPKEMPTDNKKTAGQRLRATLFVYFAQLGSEGDFEVFYNKKMEELIDKVKARLDD